MKLGKLLFGTTSREEKWADKFADWYGSVPSIKQQFWPLLAWIILALWFDPRQFWTWIMAILTILSYMTQMVLMTGSNRSAREMKKQDQKIIRLEQESKKRDKETSAKLDKILGLLTKEEEK